MLFRALHSYEAQIQIPPQKAKTSNRTRAKNVPCLAHQHGQFSAATLLAQLAAKRNFPLNTNRGVATGGDEIMPRMSD